MLCEEGRGLPEILLDQDFLIMGACQEVVEGQLWELELGRKNPRCNFLGRNMVSIYFTY
jgi:hypothetical protein